MKRGEVWVAMGDSYASKPRPVVVVQSDGLVGYESTVVCLITSTDSAGAGNRVRIAATGANGLVGDSWVMTEKVYAAKPGELRVPIGELTDDEMSLVSDGLRKVLDL